MWRVESFTRVGRRLGTPVGYPLGFCGRTHWVTRWVRFATAFGPVLARRCDALLSLGDLFIDPRLVTETVLGNWEEAFRHLLHRGFVGGCHRAGNDVQLAKICGEWMLLGVVGDQQAQIRAVFDECQARGVTQVVARIELEIVHRAAPANVMERQRMQTDAWRRRLRERP